MTTPTPHAGASPFTYDCGGEMRVANFTVAGWRVTTFEESTAIGRPSYDRISITVHNGDLQLAVLDAAINAADPDGRTKSTAALDTTIAAITEHGIDDGLEHAAQLIHDPTQTLRHRSGLVAFGAAVTSNDGWITAYRCADVEIWVRARRGTWRQLLPGDMLTERARHEYEAAVAAATEKTAFAIQEVLLDPLDTWRYPTLGLDSASHVTVQETIDVDEILISSDGATLNPRRLRKLTDWITKSIHEKPDGHRHPSAHGDLSLIWARRR